MFHRHHWKTIGERYNPRPEGMTSFKGDAESLVRVAYGFTVITQECESCGRVEARSVAGRTAGA